VAQTRTTAPARPVLFLALLLATATIAAARAPVAAAAPVLRGVSSASTSRKAPALTMRLPAGVVAGDVLVAAVDARVSKAQIKPPSGWELIRSDSNPTGATLTQAVYYRVAGTLEPSSYSWKLARMSGAAGEIVAYGGLDSPAPVDAASGGYSANTSMIVAPSVVTSLPGEVVLGFFGDNGLRTTSPPSGFTELADVATSGNSPTATSEASALAEASAGPTGDVTAVSGGSNSSSIGQLVALSPAAAPDPPVAADFTVAASPTSSTVDQGESSAADLAVGAQNGFFGWVSLAADGLPAGASANFSPGAGSGSFDSQITLSTSPSTPTGSYAVTLTAASGLLVHTATLTLSVDSSSTGGSPSTGGSTGALLPPPLPQSSGATFSVSTSGSDSNPGTATSPWRTVQHALNVLQPGQTALVHAGTYAEGVVISASGTAAAPITVAAYPGERPVLLPAAASSGDTYAVRFDGAAYVRLHGFLLAGAQGTSSADVYLYGGAHDDEISGNEITGSTDQGIFVDRTTSGIQIVGNRIHDNGAGLPGQHQSHGIYVEGGNDLIANNVIYNHPHGFGVQIYPANTGTVVVDNTIVASSHSGIVIGGSEGVSNITIRNNILAGNGSYGVEMDSSCPTSAVIDHNLFWANPGGGVESGCGGVDASGGNLNADPLFVNYPSRDLHLQAGSPAVDPALLDYSMAGDFDGALRPQGAGPDLGAYER
jgi:parallel beta-helix repeat protein